VYVCCDNGREEKNAKCIVFSLFLSLSLLALVFFCLSLFFSFVVRAQSGGYSHRKREKRKKEKRDISIQQKHNNDDAAAVYCLPTNTTYTTTIRGKKNAKKRKKKYECERARVYE
jgi:hypothetical protein